MKLMTAEKAIEYCKNKGVRVWRDGDEVMMQGGGISNLPNSSPFWRLVSLHRNILCDFFGVSR